MDNTKEFDINEMLSEKEKLDELRNRADRSNNKSSIAKDIAWDAAYNFNRSPIGREVDYMKYDIKEGLDSMAKDGKEEVNSTIHEIKRRFKFRTLKDLLFETFSEEVWDAREKKQRTLSIKKHKENIKREEETIADHSRIVSNYIERMDNKNNLSTLDKIGLNVAEKELDDLIKRKESLEAYKKRVQKEENKFEAIQAMMGGKEYFDEREEAIIPLKEEKGLSTIPSDNTSLQIIDIKEEEKTKRDPDYLKMIASRGEGVSEFRQKYRILKRNDRHYKKRIIANGILLALGVAGMTAAMYKINPDLFNQLASPPEMMQMHMNTINQVIQNIASNPSFENIDSILKQGSGAYGMSLLVGVLSTLNVLKTYINQRQNQFNIDLMEEENPLNIKDDVEAIGRHI